MLEIFDAAKALAANKTAKRLAAIALAKQILKVSGVVDPGLAQPVLPVHLAEYTPQSLEAEIERQTARYQELEYHKWLRTSAGRFKDVLMRLPVPQPETLRVRFGIPVIAFGQIPVEEQARLVGIEYQVEEGLSVSDWPKDPQRYKTPEKAYLTLMQDGTEYLNRTAETVRNSLAPDERGATQYDGIGLYVAHPEVLEVQNIELPGTEVGPDHAAVLSMPGYGYGPQLGRNYIRHGNMRLGSATCARA